jgi:hypothetical protein
VSKYIGHVPGDEGEVRVSTSALKVEVSLWPNSNHGFGDGVTPARARELAALIVKAADDAEGKGGAFVTIDDGIAFARAADGSEHPVGRLGMYEHLDKEGPFTIDVPMKDLVQKIRSMNYGEQRFLSELVKQRMCSDDYVRYAEYREHTKLLHQLIEKGFF